MSTNATQTTPHYGLSQWEGSDYIRREDFNADNAAIDAALHAQEEQMSLVKLFDTKLSDETEELVIDLSGVDMSRYLKLQLQGTLPGLTINHICRLFINGDEGTDSYGAGCFTFEEDTSSRTGNVSDTSYIAVGESLPFRGGTFFEESLCDTGAHLACIPSGYTADLSISDNEKGGVLPSRQAMFLWRNGGLADVKTLTIRYHDNVGNTAGRIPAGARFLLTGWRA